MSRIRWHNQFGFGGLERPDQGHLLKKGFPCERSLCYYRTQIGVMTQRTQSPRSGRRILWNRILSFQRRYENTSIFLPGSRNSRNQQYLQILRAKAFKSCLLKILLCNIFLGSSSVATRIRVLMIFFLRNYSSHDVHFSTRQNMEPEDFLEKKQIFLFTGFWDIRIQTWLSRKLFWLFLFFVFCFLFFFFFPIEGYAFSVP